MSVHISPVVVGQTRKTRYRGNNTRNNRIVVRVIFYAVHVASKESLLLYVYPFTVDKQRLGKHVLTAMNTHATIDV